MPPNNRRPDRVAEAIREEVASFLADGVKDPRVGFVTVTGVDLTRDLRHAKVYVSVLGSDEEKAATFEGLAAVAPRLRGHIGRALQLRLAPEIAFKPDDSIARASRIDMLLEQVKRDDASRAEANRASERAPEPAPDAAPDGEARDAGAGDDQPA